MPKEIERNETDRGVVTKKFDNGTYEFGWSLMARQAWPTRITLTQDVLVACGTSGELVPIIDSGLRMHHDKLLVSNQPRKSGDGERSKTLEDDGALYDPDRPLTIRGVTIDTFPEPDARGFIRCISDVTRRWALYCKADGTTEFRQLS